MNFNEAKNLFCAVNDNFCMGESSFLELASSKSRDRKDCYLWSYFAQCGMVYQAYKSGMKEVLPYYEKLVKGLLNYRSNPLDDGTVKYHSQRGNSRNEGHGDCFFDDNIWIARNYLFAYEVFENPEYLEEAKHVAAYVCSGWNKELGGLVWNESGLTPNGTKQELERGLSANACSIIVNAILFKITKNQYYLDWAFKFYNFCKTIQDKDTKIYYNGMHTVIKENQRINGDVNKDLYSYNTGSMILADLLLFEITKDNEYFMDAVSSANSAYSTFLRRDAKSGVAYFEDFAWFTAILAEAMYELSFYVDEPPKSFFDILGNSLDYAYNNHRSKNGLLPHDIVSGWRDNDDYNDNLFLTHSAISEMAFLILAYTANRNEE